MCGAKAKRASAEAQLHQAVWLLCSRQDGAGTARSAAEGSVGKRPSSLWTGRQVGGRLRLIEAEGVEVRGRLWDGMPARSPGSFTLGK